MGHQTQLTDSNCGQTCVAMVVGISQYDAMGAVGRDGLTTPSQIKEALWNFGFEVELRKGRKDWPPTLAILFLRTRGQRIGHAVVLRDGIVYDPSFEAPLELTHYEVWLSGCGARIGSYLVVGKKRV